MTTIDFGIPGVGPQVAAHPAQDRLVTAFPQGRAANPYDWGLGAAAVYSVMHQVPWDVVAYPAGETYDRMLRDYWGVTDRESLARQIHTLITGAHRSWMGVDIQAWKLMSDEQAVEFDGMLTRQLAAEAASDGAPGADPNEPRGDRRELTETQWRFRHVRANTYGVKWLDMLAWDYLRMLMIIRAGVGQGYLTDVEACDGFAFAQSPLQQHYDSWVSLARSFALGKWVWHGSGDKVLFVTLNGLNQLFAPGAPWATIPYAQSAPPLNGTFVAMLVSTGVLSPLTETQRLFASPWALYLDDILKASPAPVG